MTLSTWLAFTMMATLLVISPGPNGVIVLKTLGQYGYKPSLAIILGLFCATFIHGLFVLFGLSTLMLYIPQAFMTIKILGALYLGYLGIKSLKEFLWYKQRANTITHDISKSPKPNSFFRIGFITQILNPKVSAFYLAVIPNFVELTATTAKFDTLILTLTHASIVASWFIIVATVSIKLLPYFKNSSLGRWLNGAAGAVMLYFSAMLLTFDTNKTR